MPLYKQAERSPVFSHRISCAGGENKLITRSVFRHWGRDNSDSATIQKCFSCSIVSRENTLKKISSFEEDFFFLQH